MMAAGQSHAIFDRRHESTRFFPTTFVDCFSIAGNDLCSLALGDQLSSRGSQRRARRGRVDREDIEPTLVSDQLPFSKGPRDGAKSAKNRHEDEADERIFSASGCCGGRSVQRGAADVSPIGPLYEMLEGDGYSSSPRGNQVRDATACLRLKP
jgi:hypothetical protein